MFGNFLLALTACFPVEGDRIVMGDLARVIPAFSQSDPNESIGFAPAPGAQRRFSARELSRLAAGKGVTVTSEPVCFERKLQEITLDSFLIALRESLPREAELELIDFSRARVPNGVLEFPRSGLTRPHGREPAIWRGRIKYDAAQSVPVWAKVRVWTSRPTVVAVVNLPAGKPIESSQLRLDTTDADPFTNAGPLTIETVAGRAPRRPIRAGEVIPAAALKTPADVIRGETVGIEARYGAAFLKFEVRAEASGRAGDAIPVRNIESGKTFRARILRKGWVRVEQTE
jgi:flagella basal body P-ring formation protein FlgA